MCSNAQGHYGSNNSLSPAAQAVLDAATQWLSDSRAERLTIAAALRAAVEEVMPEEPKPTPNRVEPGGTHMYHHERMARWEECQDARRELLAIADELEGRDDG